MSAICGIYHLDGQPLDKEGLAKIMAAQKGYGIDGSFVWHGDSVGLGHQMTFVTAESRDEANDTLPSEQSTRHEESLELSITADARIDNREDLFDALGIRGQERGMPDSQLIVRAYQKWGRDCPRHLLGDFAFAIWDGRVRQLFVARDILGVKPFYYHDHQAANKHFIFASDIEAVLAAPQVPQALNMSFLVPHFKSLISYHHPELTCWQKIKKLPPAHAMTISAKGVNKWAYWEATERPILRLASDDEYAEMLVDILKEAVSCRLRASVPIGCHLSGGLDSSSITVLAARQMRQRNQPLTAFSWSPLPKEGEEISQDERALVKLIAEQESIPYHFANLTENLIGRYGLRRLDKSQVRYNSEEAVREHANQLGVKVLLSGWGGDELIAFNGRGYFAELFMRGRWRLMLSELQQRATLHEGRLYSGIYSKVFLPLLPDPLFFRWQKVNARLRGEPEWDYEGQIPTWFNADLSNRLRQVKNPLPPRRLREFVGVRGNQLALLAHGHLTQRVECWAAAGANHAIEYRYPLLDQRLIEFTLSLPPEMFMKYGWKRYLFRHAMTGILPEKIQWNKSKREPARPYGHGISRRWLVKELFPLLKAQLDQPQPFHYLDPKRIEEVIANSNQRRILRRGGLLPALQVELMANQGLFDSIKSL